LRLHCLIEGFNSKNFEKIRGFEKVRFSSLEMVFRENEEAPKNTLFLQNFVKIDVFLLFFFRFSLQNMPKMRNHKKHKKIVFLTQKIDPFFNSKNRDFREPRSFLNT